ncbi:hypothetical protein NPX13_g7590 [Xylaria arbuscula]|uniref:Nephrocystin 3-like N-terminal domain-containing protein n=1 Tax=Xylaria arbuscula TaxID=114810 RepID=A0A9W8NAC9_9PEZI|nr:hypothetical protein NPX13_g7590 [Xylaria arbuscula]
MGLTILVNPEKAGLDICIVHGFTGDSVKTWQVRGPDMQEKSKPGKRFSHTWIPRLIQTRNDSSDRLLGTYWPKDLLPTTVTDARIMTYGYDTHIKHAFAGQTSQNNVYNISWDFLIALEAQRQEHISERPIIFIVHSLGGIVVKEMLRRSDGCANSRAFLQSIAKSTRGIVFFGTPHGGADPRSFLLRIAERAIKAAGFSVNEAIVSTLLPSSERLLELREEFAPLVAKYNWMIHSFQEQYGLAVLGGKKVVEDGSSCLNLPTVEITEHIARNHMEMCRFMDLNDVEYVKVAAALTRMAQAIRKQHREENTGTPSLFEVQKSLSFEYDMIRFEAITAEHDNTCTWLLEKQEYLDWLNSTLYERHHGVLWVRGKPGAGKSTLTKYALKKARQLGLSQYVIFFFFNARGSEFERTTAGLYRSLITQLLTFFKENELRTILPDEIPNWDVERLQGFLRCIIEVIPARHNLICYIDALDECEEDPVREMVSFFEELGRAAARTKRNVYVWFSSRHYPHISVQHSCTFILENTSGHGRDLKTYVDDKLRIGSSKPAREIKVNLLSKASGVFLWLALVVPMLNKEYDHGRLHALQQRLRDIPSNLHALFKDMISRHSHSKAELVICLRWILYARHPLSPWQLYHGILYGTNVGPDIILNLNELQVSNDVIYRFIINASMGLAETVKTQDGNRVQFIHESVRDFLLGLNGWEAISSLNETNHHGMSHDILARCCSTCIDCLAKSSSGLPAQNEFLTYAVENVLWHAEQAQKSGSPQKCFLAKFKLESWIEFRNMTGLSTYSHADRMIYILAAEGYSNLILATNWSVSPFEAGPETASTPWRAALRSGSFETVKSLVEVEVSQHCADETFKSWDARKAALCKSLSARMMDYRNDSHLKYANETILYDTASDGDAELLRFLVMTKRFDINGIDCYGRTVMGGAARHKECLEVLLAVDGVNVNNRDKLGHTALFMPAIGGRIEVVNLLLAAPGFSPDMPDYLGRTALSYACGTWMEQIEVVQVLISNDRVNPDKRDYVGRTPLSYAAEKGHLRVMKLLTDTERVDPDSRDNRGLSCEQWYRRGVRTGKSDPVTMSRPYKSSWVLTDKAVDPNIWLGPSQSDSGSADEMHTRAPALPPAIVYYR